MNIFRRTKPNVHYNDKPNFRVRLGQCCIKIFGGGLFAKPDKSNTSSNAKPGNNYTSSKAKLYKTNASSKRLLCPTLVRSVDNSTE